MIYATTGKITSINVAPSLRVSNFFSVFSMIRIGVQISSLSLDSRLFIAFNFLRLLNLSRQNSMKQKISSLSTNIPYSWFCPCQGKFELDSKCPQDFGNVQNPIDNDIQYNGDCPGRSEWGVFGQVGVVKCN